MDLVVALPALCIEQIVSGEALEEYRQTSKQTDRQRFTNNPDIKATL